MEDGLIALAVILYGVLGYVVGYWYGKRNYTFSTKERNIIEIEVKTDVAQARLRELKKELIAFKRDLDIIRKN